MHYMFIYQALASRSSEKQKQKHQRVEQKKVNEEEKEGLKKAEVLTLSIPGSLQTVLENLPLVYNADDKNLQQVTVS
ncbi:hypothetical protein WUBG_10224, partial [Wuchereria bancrofti]